MRKLFNIPAERETRLWNKYMSNTYEQLSKLDNTVQDAGLYQGQVGGPGPRPQTVPGSGRRAWAAPQTAPGSDRRAWAAPQTAPAGCGQSLCF